MPIDVFGSLKSISDKVFAGFLGKLIESPLWISIILSLVIVLLVVFIYPAKSGTKATSIIKLWIYMFIGSFGVFLLHDSSVRYHLRREYMGTEIDDIAESILHPPASLPASPPASSPASLPAVAAAPAPPPATVSVTGGDANVSVGLPYIPVNTHGGNPFEQN